uniref:Uncharacterized protein n=1 Tax=Glycine max TaxID=3847 RepID=A0A0R0JM63_SOYBN
MEPEFWDKHPFKATTKAFQSGFHFKPTTIMKSRTFYELILVDSNSVSIKHFKDPKDQTLNTHSTIQILKVLQPRNFGSELNKGKRFSVSFDLVGYTYWDYIDAWTNKTEKTNQYPSLQRHAFVKWWTQFDSSKANPEQVKLWFQSHPEFLKAADPKTFVFLNQKSHLAVFLAGSKLKEILTKNLKKEEISSVEEEEDLFYQNEDDCFGICLD